MDGSWPLVVMAPQAGVHCHEASEGDRTTSSHRRRGHSRQATSGMARHSPRRPMLPPIGRRQDEADRGGEHVETGGDAQCPLPLGDEQPEPDADRPAPRRSRAPGTERPPARGRGPSRGPPGRRHRRRRGRCRAGDGASEASSHDSAASPRKAPARGLASEVARASTTARTHRRRVAAQQAPRAKASPIRNGSWPMANWTTVPMAKRTEPNRAVNPKCPIDQAVEGEGGGRRR